MKAKIFFLVSIISFILLSNFSKAQIFPPIKRHNVKLKLYSNSANVVYQLDSFKFYFERQTLIGFLKRQLKKKNDTVVAISLNNLKTRYKSNLIIKGGNLVFDPKTGLIDKTLLQNDYQLAMNKVLSSILLNGKVAIYDCKNHIFIESIRIEQEQSLDAKGYLEILEFYNTNKKLIYSMQFRKSEDGIGL